MALKSWFATQNNELSALTEANAREGAAQWPNPDSTKGGPASQTQQQLQRHAWGAGDGHHYMAPQLVAAAADVDAPGFDLRQVPPTLFQSPPTTWTNSATTGFGQSSRNPTLC